MIKVYEILQKPWVMATGFVATTGLAIWIWSWKILWVIGAVLLGLGVWWLVRRMREKRQAAQFRAGLNQNAGKAPSSVNDPDRRAEYDLLRGKFNQGLQRVLEEGRRKGVDFLYRHPWILVVGEPGSGKTEAVRNSGIVSPRMQDELQGVGGTLNMDWWFTERAVILDTAGRMVFEEEAAAANNEFREFLRLLRKGRPLTPINGLLVTVSADTLVGGTETQIKDRIRERSQKLAEKIAEIQNVLEVRFPVYVVVTKCDKMTGFREFFESLDEPTMLNQILGWSNPEGLDVPFKAEKIEEHLSEVIETLRDVRFGLLDRPGGMGAGKRRMDEVDSLFAFPHALEVLAPRLKLYLEPVFAAGEWSASAPLFLRGVYFSSALWQGAVLDQELAKALGVPVDKLGDEGKVFRRDRALFLRDLFVEKILPERGLVTTSHHTEGIVRRRRIKIWSTFFGMLVVGVGAIVWAESSYSVRVEQELGLWRAKLTDGKVMADRRIIPAPLAEATGKDGQWVYKGNENLTVNGQAVSRAKYQIDLEKLTRERFRVPLIFGPVAVFGANFDRQRREAQNAVFVADVVAPFVEATRDRIKADTDWSPQHSQILSLLSQTQKDLQEQNVTGGNRASLVRGLWQFGLRSPESNPALEDLFKNSYRTIAGTTPPWPPGLITETVNDAVNIGARKLAQNQTDGLNKIAAGIDMIKELRGSLLKLKSIETELSSGAQGRDLRAVVPRYAEQTKQVDELVQKCIKNLVFRDGVTLMDDARSTLPDQFRKDLEESLAELGEAGKISPVPGTEKRLEPQATNEISKQFAEQLKKANDLINNAFPGTSRAELQELDQRFLLRDSNAQVFYVARRQLLEKIVAAASPDARGTIAGFAGRLAEFDSMITATLQKKLIAPPAPIAPTGPTAPEVKPASVSPEAFQVGARNLLTQLYEEEFDRFLKERIGFPLVKDLGAKEVRVGDLPMIREHFAALKKDLKAFDPMISSDGSLPLGVKSRVTEVLSLLDGVLTALLDAEGKPSEIRVTYPNDIEQQTALGGAVGNGNDKFISRASSARWRYLGRNLKDIPEQAEKEMELGSFPLSSEELNLYFYLNNRSVAPDGPPLQPLAGWTLFSRILDRAVYNKRSADGLTWKVMYSRPVPNAEDRLLLLQFVFPKPLPALDRWPTMEQLRKK